MRYACVAQVKRINNGSYLDTEPDARADHRIDDKDYV
jgi:hypothetical protein